jgi:hypothetical protein
LPLLAFCFDISLPLSLSLQKSLRRGLAGEGR